MWFTGKERDAESGLDYFLARYYSSAEGRFTSPDPINIIAQKLVDPQQWNMYEYSKNNPLRFLDPSGRYVTTCQDGDKVCAANATDFEKSRNRDLKSKDAAVRAAAGAYGDPGNANGVTVTWGDPGAGHAANAVVTGLSNDPAHPGSFRADVTVTIGPGLAGIDLDSNVGHEGQHVEDAQGFAATVTPQGFYDLSKNLTSFQTEMSAITASGQVSPMPGPTVPILLQSALPIYPPIWRAAHISGKVAVLVSVKGGRVVGTDVQSGDSHLVIPTVSNIKTWRFGKNAGGSFTVTYTYEISGEPSDVATNPKVEVLPSLDVKITARPVKPTVNYGR